MSKLLVQENSYKEQSNTSFFQYIVKHNTYIYIKLDKNRHAYSEQYKHEGNRPSYIMEINK